MVGASHAAKEIRTAQMLKKFINDGTRVLAAPTNTPYDMMAAANIGSAKASMRSAITPNLRISSTGVIVPIICGAKMYITTPHYSHDHHAHEYGDVSKAASEPVPSGTEALSYQRGCGIGYPVSGHVTKAFGGDGK